MSTIATFDVALRANTSDFSSGMRAAGKEAEKTGGFIRNSLSIASGFVMGNIVMRGFAAATSMASDALIGYNARMEQAQMSFTTMLGSSKKATKFINQLQQFANNTPFDFPGLQRSAQLMMAMGFQSKEVLPILTAVGDSMAAMGAGSDQVQRVVYALGQMKAAGRVNGGDMMQLTSAGINGWQMLAKAMHKSIPEVRDMSKKGLIPADKAIKIITKSIEKGHMGGMMKEQAKTFNGAMSTISDTAHQLVAGALNPLFKVISGLVYQFSLFIQTPAVTAFFGTLKDGVRTLAQGLKSLISLAPGVINGLFSLFTGGAGGGADFGKNIADGIKNAGPLIFNALSKILLTIGPMVVNGFKTLLNFGSMIVSAIATQGPALLTGLLSLVTTIGNWLLTTGIPLALSYFSQMAWAAINWVGDAVPKLIAALPQLINAFTTWLNTDGSKLLDQGIKLGKKVLDGVVTFFRDQAGPKVQEALQHFGDWLTTGDADLATKGLALAGVIVGGLMLGNVLFGAAGTAAGVVWRAAFAVAGKAIDIVSWLLGTPLKMMAVVGSVLGTAFKLAWRAAAWLVGVAEELVIALLELVTAGAMVGGVVGFSFGAAFAIAVLAAIVMILGPQKVIDVFVSPFKMAFDQIGVIFDSIGSLLGGRLQSALDILWAITVGAMSLILAPFIIFLNLINELFKTVFNVDIIATVQGWIGDFVRLLQSVPGKLSGLGKQIIDPIVSGIRTGVNTALSVISNLVNGVIDVLNSIHSFSWGKMGVDIDLGPLADFAGIQRHQWLGTDAGSFQLWPKMAHVSFGSTPVNHGGHAFKQGLWEVPYDNMPAYLHRGETVVPADFERRLNSAVAAAVGPGGVAGSELHVHVHDEDGGLARSGMTEGTLADAIVDTFLLRQSSQTRRRMDVTNG